MKTFWLLVLCATILWYGAVTFRVVGKGWKDVKRLLDQNQEH